MSDMVGSLKLVACAVAVAEDFVKVENSQRKITLCPTRRCLSAKSCSVMPAFLARMFITASGMPYFEQNLFSKGELSPASPVTVAFLAAHFVLRDISVQSEANQKPNVQTVQRRTKTDM